MNSERDGNDDDRQSFGMNTGDSANPYSRLGQPTESSTNESQFSDAENDSPSTSGAVLINGICVLLIGAVVAFVMFFQQAARQSDEKATPQAELAELMIQGKIALGFKSIIESNPTLQGANNDLQEIPFGIVGSVRVRQAGAIMIAELESNDDALVVLEKLEESAEKLGYTFSEREKKTNSILRILFEDSASALTPADKSHLEAELLWFGQLGLHPKVDQKQIDKTRSEILKGSESAVFVFAGLSLLGIVCLVVGLIGGIVMLVLYQNERLDIRTRSVTSESSIFLESFTVWILTFLLFQIAIGAVGADAHPLVSNAIVFFASMIAALVWSVMRGKFDRQHRSDIGFRGNPLQEVPAAIWCYICSLPLVALGLFTSLYLISVYAKPGEPSLRSSGPTHPIIEWIVSGDKVSIALIFFVACVCAPVVEETMFRGYLYRSLRDGTYRLGHFGSVLFSALVNGLLFAAIHPQGVFFIPALCSLAMGFSFAREWRGSLWTPMIMHAIHNGILTATLVYCVAA